nr:MAG TPA: hypothetical protein [Caudoviricetes sp.]
MSSLKELLGKAYKEGMSLEEIDTALADMTFHTDSDFTNLKNNISKLTSECKEWKTKYQSTLDAGELAKQQAEEERENMLNELNLLKREKNIADLKSQFLGIGYGEELASDTAIATLDGNTQKVLENQKKFADELVATTKKNLIKDNPKPQGTGSGNANVMTREKFSKLPPREKVDFIANHRDEYDAIYSEN